MMAVNSLRFCSYNMHGYNMGKSCLTDICSVSDVILIQEHWLFPDNLHVLNNIDNDFLHFANSAMEKKLTSGVFRGRPFGGVAILVNKALACCTTLITNVDRLVIVKIGDVYVINVYLPDSSVCNREDIVSDICGQIEANVSFTADTSVVLGGDFNFEFVGGKSCFQDFDSFVADNDLCICDSKFGDNARYTYYHESRGCSSWIDHFVVSRYLFDRVTDADIIESGCNLSDHCPVWIEFSNMNSVTTKLTSQANNNGNRTVTSLRWDKADIVSYHEATNVLSSNMCLDTDIDNGYDQILTVLNTAACLHVPKVKACFFKYYWDDELKDIKSRSVYAHRLWLECGRPRSGPVYHEKRTTKAEYKRAIRNKRRNNHLDVSNDLHECLLNKDPESFWKSWHGKFGSGSKAAVTECVDGLSDGRSIAELFANNFEQACKPNCRDRFDSLKHDFDISYANYKPSNTDSVITVDLVMNNISKLKCGKAAGIDSVTAEHLKYAHHRITILLCILFNKMLIYGRVPELFCNGIIVPVPKNKAGDLSDSTNYRGITLSPVISKVFEMCLLDLYGDYLYSHDLQFGFKKQQSCSHAIFCMRKVVDYFTARGSDVNICSLDVSKAFDKVNHYALYLKLMKRHIPLSFMRILIHWYSNCAAIVKWNSCLSSCFSLLCGVRQGGVLSPVLFAVYVNDLILKLISANLGCRIGDTSICCLFYADDIVLLASSVSKLQLMLSLCDDEMLLLDLKFNPSKCHVLRIGKKYNSECSNVTINDVPVAYVESVTYLGTVIKAGRVWRTDSSTRRRQCFKAFNSIYCRSPYLSEPTMQQLTDAFCKPVLLYNIAAVNLSKSECNRIDSAWKMIMYKIYGVSGDALKFVYAYTNCLPLPTDIATRKLKFLRNCASSNNGVVRTIFDWFGDTELKECYQSLDLDETHVRCLTPSAIKNIVLDLFKCSLV